MGHPHASAARLLCFATALLAALLAATSPPALRAAATGAPCAPDSGSATISGTVTAGGVGANFVLVTAYTTYGDRAGYGTSNASGAYQISGLLGGSYILEFKPSGGAYMAGWYNGTTSPTSATPVVVTTGGTTSGINAALALGARISGTVTGAGVGPLAFAQVFVYDSSGSQVASASADAAGVYLTSPGLAPGSYRVRFSGTGGFLGAYYNGKDTLVSANPVTLAGSATTSGINAALALGGTVSGRVTAVAGGAGVAGASVSVSGSNGYGYDFTDASGNYSVSGLPSGSYTVSVSSPSGSTLAGATQSVNVTAPGTTSNVNAALAQGGKLTGHVTAEGGAALSGITVYISNEDGSFQDYFSTNASGVYEASGLPSGRYMVLFRPSSTYIPEAYNDHPDFELHDYVTVTAPNTTSNIDAVLTPGGSVSGTVTDASSGAPIKDVFVEVLDATGDRVDTDFTDAAGVYQTPSTLPSGSYRVRFNADERFASCVFVTEYSGGVPTLATAAPVAVTAGSNTANINTTMDRGSLVFGFVRAGDTGAPITSGSVRFLDASGQGVGFGRLTFLGGYHTETALPSGGYKVLFSDGDGGYVDEYYDDQPTRAAGTTLVLNAPTDRSGVDAVLTKGGLISGRVTDAATGLPFVDGYVVVYSGAGVEAGSGEIAADGTYVVRSGLASGSYKVVVFPYGQSEVEALAAAPAAVSAATSIVPTSFGGGFGAAGGDAVAVASPSTTSGIDIAVRRGTFLPLASK